MSEAAALDREVDRKAWATLAAHAALRGYQLWRSDAADGPQRFFLGKLGLIRVCADLDEVDRVLERASA